MRCNPHVFPLILNNVYHRTLRKPLLQSNVEEVDSICSPQSGHRQQKTIKEIMTLIVLLLIFTDTKISVSLIPKGHFCGIYYQICLIFHEKHGFGIF